MTRLLLGFWMAFLFTGCFVSSGKNLTTSDVYFTCPDGWKITEEKQFAAVTYVSIENKEFGSSGLFTVSWSEIDEFDGDLDDLIAESKDFHSSSIILRNANLQFSDTYTGEFNGIKSRQTDYTMSLFKIPHQGRIIAFNVKGKTFVITKQGADDDLNENEIGFDILENSFRVTEEF